MRCEVEIELDPDGRDADFFQQLADWPELPSKIAERWGGLSK
jgi:hypothetical protein